MLAPLNVTVRTAEFKYRPDWTPSAFTLDATVNGTLLQLRTDIRRWPGGHRRDRPPAQPVSVAHTVAPRTLIHANGVFASYVALARRLVENSEEGAEFRVYVVPQAEITVRVKAIHRERMQIGTSVLDVRRFELVYVNPSGEVATNLTAGDDGGLVRVNIPARVAGHRARGRRVIDVPHADLFESRRRSGHHPRCRLQPRRDADATGGSGDRRRDFRRSCCLPERASATATEWFRACRRWRSWRERSPKPACWRFATTSAATGRAAADRSPPR